LILRLTEKQLIDLSEILWSIQDEGPEGEGWASEKLIELRLLIGDLTLS